MKVFISHSSKNGLQANEFCDAIESRGHGCFIAPRNIRTGYEYASEILNGIDSSDVVLLLLSNEANDSPHVLREIERTVSRRIPIVVYKLEEVVLSKSLEYFLMTPQWFDNTQEKDWDSIVNSMLVLANGQKDTSNVIAENNSTTADEVVLDTVRKTKKFIILILVGIIVTALLGGGIWMACKDEQVSVNDEYEDREEKENKEYASVSLGDTITLGEYYSEPIKWRVIKVSEDGKSAVVIADKILTMKAYDAAEGGAFNLYNGEEYWNIKSAEIDKDIQIQIRGNNSWELSNIRMWLNSDTESVIYNDQIPCDEAMSEKNNGYNDEAGFLRYFSEEEKAAILVTKVITGDKVTEDKVFLISRDELKWLEEANVDVYAVPTTQAREFCESNWYICQINDYSVYNHYWWLRDSDEETTCNGYVVCPSFCSELIMSDAVGLEGNGIRPAMTIDLSKVTVNK